MADDPRYSAEVRRRMDSVAGAGRLPPGVAVAAGSAGDVEQGARVEFEFQVQDERVARGAFRAFGCPHFIAAASWITDRLRGEGRDALAAWDWREAARALDVPPAKYGRLLTVQDAVRDAARNWPGPGQSTV
jgi:NifU-like protein involved in Fe-S cluster formation